jgi:hypothetical protein
MSKCVEDDIACHFCIVVVVTVTVVVVIVVGGMTDMDGHFVALSCPW